MRQAMLHPDKSSHICCECCTRPGPEGEKCDNAEEHVAETSNLFCLDFISTNVLGFGTEVVPHFQKP